MRDHVDVKDAGVDLITMMSFSGILSTVSREAQDNPLLMPLMPHCGGR